MKETKGITLITVIMTVLLLTILAGLVITNSVNTYQDAKVIKFETYMNMIQKKVDLMLDEDVDYRTLGAELTEDQTAKIQEIISEGNIATKNITAARLRYFSGNDIYSVFGISEVSDDIVINFTNRDIISLNGIEKDGVTYYTAYNLH